MHAYLHRISTITRRNRHKKIQRIQITQRKIDFETKKGDFSDKFSCVNMKMYINDGLLGLG